MKIIHSADWQLGKPFGRFEADVRAALTEARFDAIDAIGKAAAQHDAGHVWSPATFSTPRARKTG